ncbi:MAG: Lrp/AsnC family transcriptional regulator [Burkholderiales bacterium]|nr:Lrp/AsnC family transcriptional regulator [Burkholderiales bacterium]
MITLDDLDHRILNALQDQADRSNLEIARLIGLSPAATLRRIKRLKDRGVIERVVAVLNPQAVGAGLLAVVEVSLERQGEHALQAFAALACKQAEVQQCYQVSPGPDFVLIAQVPDMPAYHAFSQRLLTEDANVRHVKAYFSVKRHTFKAGLNLKGMVR